MTTFLLIRHAATDDIGRTLSGRAPGVHLNEEGIDQARLLAHRLQPIPLAAIYACPLERARETALPIARARSLSVRQQDDLGELDYGEWTGREIESLRDDPAWQGFVANRSIARIPRGESMLDMQLRVVNALSDLRGVHRGEVVAIVTHADPIRAALAYFTGAPIDMSLRMEISPASISIVRLTSQQPSILAINDNGLQMINGLRR